MIKKIYITISFILALVTVLQAQEKEKVRKVEIRAVFHDSINPDTSLFYADKDGQMLPLAFRAKALSRTVMMVPVNDSIVLYDKADVDPENPTASMAASVKISANIKKAILVVLRFSSRKGAAYKMLILEDSQKAFPKGESRVLTFTKIKTAIQAGEHKLAIKLGHITRIPPVKKVNDFNMAQTNFYYKQEDAWVVFTERQLQFHDACRRLFIVHTTPGARVPRVTTIVDVSKN